MFSIQVGRRCGAAAGWGQLALASACLSIRSCSDVAPPTSVPEPPTARPVPALRPPAPTPQVLSKALEIFGLGAVPFTSPDPAAAAARQDATACEAFICNLQG